MLVCGMFNWHVLRLEAAQDNVITVSSQGAPNAPSFLCAGKCFFLHHAHSIETVQLWEHCNRLTMVGNMYVMYVHYV